jgi:hypothetical protein
LAVLRIRIGAQLGIGSERVRHANSATNGALAVLRVPRTPAARTRQAKPMSRRDALALTDRLCRCGAAARRAF